MASLTPNLASEPSMVPPRDSTISARSPEEIRNLLSIYRSGMERGRKTASEMEHERPADDDNPPSSRSEHDAAQ
jgi:hypothetical protein